MTLRKRNGRPKGAYSIIVIKMKKNTNIPHHMWCNINLLVYIDIILSFILFRNGNTVLEILQLSLANPRVVTFGCRKRSNLLCMSSMLYLPEKI